MVRLRIMGDDGPARTRATPPPGRLLVPAVQIGAYTDANWEAESYAIFAEGGDPSPCPDCGRTGFYGPRFTDPDRKCRACRFCGFFQAVNGEIEHYVPTAHDCDRWPTVSRAVYLWWVDPDLERYACPFCDGEVEVAEAQSAPPLMADDHPWWRIPQHRPQSFYKGLWRNWEYSKGRVLL